LQGLNLNNETMSIAEKVLSIIRGSKEPLSAGQIAEMGGLDRKEVDRAMNELKKSELIVSPKRCYWEAR